MYGLRLSPPYLLPFLTSNHKNIMEVSKDLIEKMEKLSLEKEGKEMSDQEAYEAASNFTGFVELMYELGMKEAKRKAWLKKENPELVRKIILLENHMTGITRKEMRDGTMARCSTARIFKSKTDG